MPTVILIASLINMFPHKPITNIVFKMLTYSAHAGNDRTMTMDLIQYTAYIPKKKDDHGLDIR